MVKNNRPIKSGVSTPDKHTPKQIRKWEPTRRRQDKCASLSDVLNNQTDKPLQVTNSEAPTQSNETSEHARTTTPTRANNQTDPKDAELLLRLNKYIAELYPREEEEEDEDKQLIALKENFRKDLLQAIQSEGCKGKTYILHFWNDFKG